MDEPTELINPTVRGRDLPGAVKVMPLGLDAAIKKRASGEFKSEKSGSSLTFSKISSNQSSQQMQANQLPANGMTSQISANQLPANSMTSQISSNQMSSSMMSSSMTKQVSSSSTQQSFQSFGSSKTTINQDFSTVQRGDTVHRADFDHRAAETRADIERRSDETAHREDTGEIKQSGLKQQLTSVISEIESEIGQEFKENIPANIKSPTPGRPLSQQSKQDMFSPPPLGKHDFFSPPPLEPVPTKQGPHACWSSLEPVVSSHNEPQKSAEQQFGNAQTSFDACAEEEESDAFTSVGAPLQMMQNGFSEFSRDQVDRVGMSSGCRLRRPGDFKPRDRPCSLPADFTLPASLMSLPELAALPAGKAKPEIETLLEENEDDDVTNREVHQIQEQSSSSFSQTVQGPSLQESGSGSSLLQKIMTPAPVEFDSSSLKRRDPRKMFTDSSFYSAKHHPTVADQVEMAHRLSSAIFNRAQKNGGDVVDDVDQPRHDTVPNLKLVMNPEGKVHEWSDLDPSELPNAALMAGHAAPSLPSPDVNNPMVEDLNNSSGRGQSHRPSSNSNSFVSAYRRVFDHNRGVFKPKGFNNAQTPKAESKTMSTPKLESTLKTVKVGQSQICKNNDTNSVINNSYWSTKIDSKVDTKASSLVSNIKPPKVGFHNESGSDTIGSPLAPRSKQVNPTSKSTDSQARLSQGCSDIKSRSESLQKPLIDQRKKQAFIPSSSFGLEVRDEESIKPQSPRIQEKKQFNQKMFKPEKPVSPASVKSTMLFFQAEAKSNKADNKSGLKPEKGIVSRTEPSVVFSKPFVPSAKLVPPTTTIPEPAPARKTTRKISETDSRKSPMLAKRAVIEQVQGSPSASRRTPLSATNRNIISFFEQKQNSSRPSMIKSEECLIKPMYPTDTMKDFNLEKIKPTELLKTPYLLESKPNQTRSENPPNKFKMAAVSTERGLDRTTVHPNVPTTSMVAKTKALFEETGKENFVPITKSCTFSSFPTEFGERSSSSTELSGMSPFSTPRPPQRSSSKKVIADYQFKSLNTNLDLCGLEGSSSKGTASATSTLSSRPRECNRHSGGVVVLKGASLNQCLENIGLQNTASPRTPPRNSQNVDTRQENPSLKSKMEFGLADPNEFRSENQIVKNKMAAVSADPNQTCSENLSIKNKPATVSMEQGLDQTGTESPNLNRRPLRDFFR